VADHASAFKAREAFMAEQQPFRIRRDRQEMPEGVRIEVDPGLIVRLICGKLRRRLGAAPAAQP
jgi:hypothetical protein